MQEDYIPIRRDQLLFSIVQMSLKSSISIILKNELIAPASKNRPRYLDLSEFVNIRLSTVSAVYLSFYGLFLVLLIGTNILFSYGKTDQFGQSCASKAVFLARFRIKRLFRHD